MLEARHLTKTYGTRKAVDNLSFTIQKNEAVALLGLNGAGKTTTLRILTGFLFPTSGEVFIGGFSLLDDPVRAKQLIGYLPENPLLYPEMKVHEFLRYMYRLHTGTRNEEETAIEIAMSRTQITARAHDTIGSLSAGFRKRLALAQAIVHNPQVVVMDEPIADLDPKQIMEIRALIQELKQSHALLISSHILSEVAQTADRFLFLHDGKLVAEETPAGLTRLAGGDRLTLRAHATAQELRDILHTTPHLIKIQDQPLGDGTTRMHLVFETGHIEIQEVSRRLLEKNIDLVELGRFVPDLESVFLKLTAT